MIYLYIQNNVWTGNLFCGHFSHRHSLAYQLYPSKDSKKIEVKLSMWCKYLSISKLRLFKFMFACSGCLDNLKDRKARYL